MDGSRARATDHLDPRHCVQSTGLSNGLLEGLNSLIQASKRRARGYRSTRNYIAMIYLVVGKLEIEPAG